MKLINEFRYPPFPTRLRGKDEKFNTTYIRANKALEKVEMMGYGAESGSMNGHDPWFTLVDSNDGVFQKKLFQMNFACWFDPKAYIEHIPQDWGKVDLALYHSYGDECILSDTCIRVFVCSQEEIFLENVPFEQIFSQPCSERDNQGRQGIIREHITTLEIPEQFRSTGPYSLKVDVYAANDYHKQEWTWEGCGITKHDGTN